MANSMGARGKRERAEPRSKHIKLAVGWRSVVANCGGGGGASGSRVQKASGQSGKIFGLELQLKVCETIVDIDITCTHPLPRVVPCSSLQLTLTLCLTRIFDLALSSGPVVSPPVSSSTTVQLPA